MYREVRQFYRGGPNPQRRRFRGQFMRRRSPSGGYDSSPPPPQHPHQHQQQHQQQQQHQHQHHQQQPPPAHNRPNTSVQKRLDELETKINDMLSKIDLLETRCKSLEERVTQEPTTKPQTDDADARRKAKFLKQRAKKAAKLAEKRASDTAVKESVNGGSVSRGQKFKSRGPKPDTAGSLGDNLGPQGDGSVPLADNSGTKADNSNSKPDKLSKISRNSINDDSTTQPAEPSSEERLDGDGNGRERVKILRKKQHSSRRGAYRARRRRADSSERNSNDTSPQGEVHPLDDSQKKRNNRKVYPQLSEDELNEIVQTLKRQFINYEKPLEAIKATMKEKGPIVVYEFCATIFDHAICDVASPTKLSEIANNLFQLLVSEVDFRKGFYDALNSISKREEEIAIDAPRYLDTLGQILAECLVLMHNKHINLIVTFIDKCLKSYCEKSRANLLASTMRSIASIKNERFAKEIWTVASLAWDKILDKSINQEQFLEEHGVKFTNQYFLPEPKESRTSPKQLEQFADEVTSMVEKRWHAEVLKDVVAGLDLEKDEEVEYLSTLIYAIVRGCVSAGSGDDYKLDTEALNEYSSLLITQHNEHNDIALQALTALTKLWHEYNCPQDLMRSILNALHTKGAASYETLDRWLNSPNLANIPGIGAARLSSKRYIEDLGNSLKASA